MRRKEETRRKPHLPNLLLSSQLESCQSKVDALEKDNQKIRARIAYLEERTRRLDLKVHEHTT